MILGNALPLIAGAAALPVVGEAAIAAGAPALAARAVTGAAGGALFGKMKAPAAMVAREASYQASGSEQANPQLDQLLANNDLTPFPNIQRAMQESGGQQLLQHAFGSLNGQPLEPEANNNAPAVNPQDLLTPEPLAGHGETG